MAQLVERKYRFTDATLVNSGVTFSGVVTFREGKLYKTDAIKCKYNNESFNFTLKNREDEVFGPEAQNKDPWAWSEPTFSTPGWPSGLSVNDTLEEFKATVIVEIEG